MARWVSPMPMESLRGNLERGKRKKERKKRKGKGEREKGKGERGRKGERKKKRREKKDNWLDFLKLLKTTLICICFWYQKFKFLWGKGVLHQELGDIYNPVDL